MNSTLNDIDGHLSQYRCTCLDSIHQICKGGVKERIFSGEFLFFFLSFSLPVRDRVQFNIGILCELHSLPSIHLYSGLKADTLMEYFHPFTNKNVLIWA